MFPSSSSSAPPRWWLLAWLLLLLSSSSTHLRHHHHCCLAKEIEPTKDWQRLGENDTVPAGMHIRMDMTTGEKWVKIPNDEEQEENVGATAAVIQTDGSVQLVVGEENNHNQGKSPHPRYDFEMMHRTLSKLPEEEMERFGGLPALPDNNNNAKRTVLTSKERQTFEARLAQIWEQRQAELVEAQTQLLDIPQVLKERISGIRDYLNDPLEHLKTVDLEKDDDDDDHQITDIVSLLKDLEYQLTDVDNARDFHTLGGWELLVSLLVEALHVQNKTITKLSRTTEDKIRIIQAYAAWNIGTLVKNTEEFFPYALELVQIGPHSMTTTTTALDMLLEVFCEEYKDDRGWPVRTLLAKSIYSIGSLLRSNRLSQAYFIQKNGAARLSKKLRHLVMGNNDADMKVIQRLVALAGDLVSDIQLDDDAEDEASTATTLKDSIIQAFTTAEWCAVVSTVLVSDTYLPVRVQETVMETAHTLASYCSSSDNPTSGSGWKEKSVAHKAAIQRLQNEWQQNKQDFDADHFQQLNEQAEALSKVL